MVSVGTVHLCHLHVKASVDRKSGCGGVLIKPGIQKQAAGHILPSGCSLSTPGLEH